MNQNNETFLAEYLKDLQKLSYSLNKDTLIQMSKKIIATAKSKGNIIIVGNGGSASIASHVSVDFLKSVGIRACTFNESSLITCFAMVLHRFVIVCFPFFALSCILLQSAT